MYGFCIAGLLRLYFYRQITLDSGLLVLLFILPTRLFDSTAISSRNASFCARFVLTGFFATEKGMHSLKITLVLNLGVCQGCNVGQMPENVTRRGRESGDGMSMPGEYIFLTSRPSYSHSPCLASDGG